MKKIEPSKIQQKSATPLKKRTSFMRIFLFVSVPAIILLVTSIVLTATGNTRAEQDLRLLRSVESDIVVPPGCTKHGDNFEEGSLDVRATYFVDYVCNPALSPTTIYAILTTGSKAKGYTFDSADAQATNGKFVISYMGGNGDERLNTDAFTGLEVEIFRD